MPGLIVVSEKLPGAESLREMFDALGFTGETRAAVPAALVAGDPRAILLEYDGTVIARVGEIRAGGYQGVLLVLGLAAADLDSRHRLASSRAWFLPAYSGPGDVAARVRQMLG